MIVMSVRKREVTMRCHISFGKRQSKKKKKIENSV